MISKAILLLLIIELFILLTQFQVFISKNAFAYDGSSDRIVGFSYERSYENPLVMPHLQKPVYLSIPRLGIRSPVDKGYIKNDNTWKVYMNKLSYADGLGDINNIYSNIVIYGHATENILGNLYKIQKGDKIDVFGYDIAYRYKVVSIERILPDEPDKLTSFGDTNLSIFTCDGEEDEYRLLVKSKLVSFEDLSQKEVL